ncbi:MAG: A/G-specific adenine glycosylase [Candidatus Hydrogenedentes bacterium]|nr:A/G-specific adenine glycosylase [Candidatus Hydrogenedentota bacterium]
MNDAPSPPARVVSALRRRLLAWYGRHARDLPWRGSRDPYAIWVSEIMLQQTRIDQGTPYFERFMAAFPTVFDLAAAPEDRVLKLWEGLGYYARARNLHRAAKGIAGERAGRFPDTAAGWRKVPGVGRYTAGAIASIAFGERAAVLDGNVIRVLTRLFDIRACADDAATRRDLWGLAERLVPVKRPGDFNQAMMELGACVCTPKAPQCAACPARALCRAHALGVEAERPVRRAKAAVPHQEAVAAAIRKNGRYLLGKRPGGGLLGGLWELPGGTVGPGESHAGALERILRDELGMAVRVGGLVASIDHAYSHFTVTVHVYRCAHMGGTPSPKTHTELRWTLPGEFGRFAFPKANLKVLPLL